MPKTAPRSTYHVASNFLFADITHCCPEKDSFVFNPSTALDASTDKSGFVYGCDCLAVLFKAMFSGEKKKTQQLHFS